MKTIKLAALAFAAATLVQSAAQAETLPTSEVSVNYSNLSDPVQVKALKKTIRRAAIRVCQTPQERERGPQSFDLPCFAKANRDAKRELDRLVVLAQSNKAGSAGTLVLASPLKTVGPDKH